MNYLKDGIKTFTLLIISTLLAYLYFISTGHTTNITTLYVLYVFLVARFTSGYIWCIVASIGGMLGVNYLFTYPYFAFNFTLSGYPLTFLGMVTIAIITSTLTAHTKEQARNKALREAYLSKLNDINKELLILDSTEQIISLILNYILTSANISCAFYKEDPITGTLPEFLLTKPEDESIFTSSYEQAVAHLAYVSQKPMGMEDNNPDSNCFYFPIISHNHVWGLLALLSKDNPFFVKENFNFLTLTVTQMALALERQNLSDKHHKLALESEKEKMRANLLRAVSHDLRTPLTSIIGASSAYIENTMKLSNEEKLDLITHIHEDSNWLLHMVENLLSVTRIVKETAKVIKSPEVLEEVISEAVNRVKKRCPEGIVYVTIPNEMIIVPMDATLIEQVIINLVENAIKHSHTQKPILVNAHIHNDFVTIDVIDEGIGIPKNKLATIFDGYTLDSNESSDTTKGIGIGLSICKTIISAHSGMITAKNLEKGAMFSFSLPLEMTE